MSLDELRQKIDEIDTELLRLLNERADVVHEVGEIKKRDGLQIGPGTSIVAASVASTSRLGPAARRLEETIETAPLSWRSDTDAS